MKKILCKDLVLALALLASSMVLANKTLAVEALADRTAVNRITTAIEPYPSVVHKPISLKKTDNPVASLNTSNLELAQEYSNQANDITSDDPMDQITNVSQFKDVQPSDWAFQALNNIVQKYGCLQGYPDGTYRGNRALSRYEFAAGLNACLKQIEVLISSQKQGVSQDDFQTLGRLSEEFKTEIATLSTRVDKLSNSTAFLEGHQFSTTTKLYGNIIIAATGVGGGKKPHRDDPEDKMNTNFILSDRVDIDFSTSFTGRDHLLARLSANNTQQLGTTEGQGATGTNMARLAFDEDSGNSFGLNILEYSFPLGEKIKIKIAPQEEFYELLEREVEEVSPLGDEYNGSISRFGRFNSIFYLGGDKTSGASISYQVNKAAKLTVAYMTGINSSNPSSGIFGGSYVGLAQLTLRPIAPLAIGLTYAHSYITNLTDQDTNLLDTGVGSSLANQLFPNVTSQRASANSYGAELAYRANPGFTLAGWVGYTNALNLGGAGKANIVSWAVTLAFPDLGKEGNLAALVIGEPPKVTSSNYLTDGDTSLHLEALYRYALTDNIAITPGIFVITNPEHNKNNDTIYVGTLRTVFSF